MAPTTRSMVNPSMVLAQLDDDILNLCVSTMKPDDLACSWYRSCDLTALTPTPLGYRTFTMPGRKQWHHQDVVGSAAASEALFNAAYDQRQNRQLLNSVPF